MNHVFTVKQMMEKCCVKNKCLHLAIIDLGKSLYRED